MKLNQKGVMAIAILLPIYGAFFMFFLITHTINDAQHGRGTTRTSQK